MMRNIALPPYLGEDVRSYRRQGEGMTAANSLPGENQSLGDLNLFFVTRRRIPCALLCATAVLELAPGVAFGEAAGAAKQEKGCSGDTDVERVQCVANVGLEDSDSSGGCGVG